ncbi:MAG: repeat-containing protein [Pedosphaera sp.]|nr:repeat-containing protein [Pedosphaera sp.]
MFANDIRDRQSPPKKAWRKRRLIAIASMLVLLAVGLIWLLPTKPEPMLQGKPESWWVNGLIGNATTPAQWASLGTNGVQLLIKTLQNKGDPLHNVYVKSWPKLPTVFRDRLPRPIPLDGYRFEAAIMLGEIKAKVAVPVLLRALQDEEPGVRMNSALSLGYLGKSDKSIRLLFPQAMMNKDNHVRGNIIAAIGSYDQSPDSTAMLLKAMADPAPEVRSTAAIWLLRNDPQAAVNAGAVPLLLRCLEGANLKTVGYALNALSELPAVAMPALKSALQDPDPQIREAAGKVLEIKHTETTSKPAIN